MIHETAIVHEGATIGEGVEIGPYSVVGDHVTIGEGTVVGPHVVIDGWTEIGRRCRIFQYASVYVASGRSLRACSRATPRSNRSRYTSRRSPA